MANENRIVRVRNDKLDDLLSWVSVYCGVPYQTAFEEWIQLMSAGYVWGEHTNVMLVDRVRRRIQNYEA